MIKSSNYYETLVERIWDDFDDYVEIQDSNEPSVKAFKVDPDLESWLDIIENQHTYTSNSWTSDEWDEYVHIHKIVRGYEPIKSF